MILLESVNSAAQSSRNVDELLGDTLAFVVEILSPSKWLQWLQASRILPCNVPNQDAVEPVISHLRSTLRSPGHTSKASMTRMGSILETENEVVR